VLALVTLIAALAVQTVPEPFQALMWRVWLPAEADACVLIEVPLTIVVAPLSSE
jgi:hypothetical protein